MIYPMNKIDYILVMVLMVLLSGCNSLFDKEIPESQMQRLSQIRLLLKQLCWAYILIWGTMVCFLLII